MNAGRADGTPSSVVRAGRLVAAMRRHAGLMTALVVGVVILTPVLFQRGFLLRYDMVFVPHLAFSPGTLGADGGVPRAVPNDLVVALLDIVLPGWVTQRLVLLSAFVAIGWGVDRWRRGPAATIVATVALIWNPWEGERLAIGHWGYLWGYAGLVWALVGAMAWRRRGPRGSDLEDGGDGDGRLPRPQTTVVIALVMSALSGSTGGVLVAGALVVLLAWPGPHRPSWRRWIVGVVAWVALNAAWWFPFLSLAPTNAADSWGVSAFASRPDGAGGLLSSLFTGGGIWHQASWFSSRASFVLVLVALIFVVLGMAALVAGSGPRVRWAPLGLGLVGLLVAGAASLPGGSQALTWFITTVPGGGLLRDGQKFVAWWIVPAALGCGLGAEALRKRASGTLLAPAAVVAGLAVPLVTLPDLAFSHHGQWRASSYPREFTDVAHLIDSQASEGEVVAVFPWQLYRQYAWNADAVVLDPWERLLSAPVVINDDLPLRGGVVTGESPDAARISAVLRAGDTAGLEKALAGAGVRYVIEQKDQPLPSRQRISPRAGRIVHDGALLRVRDLVPAAGSHHNTRRSAPWYARAGLVMTGGAVVLLLGSVTRGSLARRRVRRGSIAASPSP